MGRTAGTGSRIPEAPEPARGEFPVVIAGLAVAGSVLARFADPRPSRPDARPAPPGRPVR